MHFPTPQRLCGQDKVCVVLGIQVHCADCTDLDENAENLVTVTTAAEIRKDFFPPLYWKEGKMKISLNILRCKKTKTPNQQKNQLSNLGF